MQITTQTSREISAYGGTAEATYSALRIHTQWLHSGSVWKRGAGGGIVNPRDVTLGSTQVFISGERKFKQEMHTRVTFTVFLKIQSFLNTQNYNLVVSCQPPQQGDP